MEELLSDDMLPTRNIKEKYISMLLGKRNPFFSSFFFKFGALMRTAKEKAQKSLIRIMKQMH